MGYIENLVKEGSETAGLLSGRLIYVNAEIIETACDWVNVIHERNEDIELIPREMRALERQYIVIAAALYNIFTEVGVLMRYEEMTGKRMNPLEMVRDFIYKGHGACPGDGSTRYAVEIIVDIVPEFQTYFHKRKDLDYLDAQLCIFYEEHGLSYRHDTVKTLLARMGDYKVDGPQYVVRIKDIPDDELPFA